MFVAAGGAGGDASQTRNGPTRPASGPPKFTSGNTVPPKKSESSVKVRFPLASACTASVPKGWVNVYVAFGVTPRARRRSRVNVT